MWKELYVQTQNINKTICKKYPGDLQLLVRFWIAQQWTHTVSWSHKREVLNDSEEMQLVGHITMTQLHTHIHTRAYLFNSRKVTTYSQRVCDLWVSEYFNVYVLASFTSIVTNCNQYLCFCLKEKEGNLEYPLEQTGKCFNTTTELPFTLFWNINLQIGLLTVDSVLSYWIGGRIKSLYL